MINLTQELLDNTNSNQIICSGTAIDNQNGLFMTNTNKELTWIAKKGQADDWAVYTHFSSKTIDFIISNGDKVHSRRNLQKILHFTEDVYSKYRH